jgi:hypothetical protein
MKSEHGALVERYWQANTEALDKNLSHFRFVHNEPTWTGEELNPDFRGKKPKTICFSHNTPEFLTHCHRGYETVLLCLIITTPITPTLFTCHTHTHTFPLLSFHIFTGTMPNLSMCYILLTSFVRYSHLFHFPSLPSQASALMKFQFVLRCFNHSNHEELHLVYRNL